jgi:hypothetical protein
MHSTGAEQTQNKGSNNRFSDTTKGRKQMNTEIFENELKQLAMMAESWDSDTLFNVSYEQLLGRIKTSDSASRHDWLLRLKKLAMIQVGFLMNAWLRADREQGMQ